MKWLRNLLAAPRTPRYGAESDGVDPIDWKQLEDRLFDLAIREIDAFAKKHAGESFYGLAFDCDSESGEILVCLNTRDGQAEVARRFEGHPQMYRGKSATEIAAELEWDVGGWKYHAINLGSRRWEGGWGAVQAQVTNATNTYLNSRNASAHRRLREDFIAMASRAVLRLAHDEGVVSLRKDPAFRVLCTDRAEGPDEGFARLARMAESGG